MWICVPSKDVRKQFVRTSLNRLEIHFIAITNCSAFFFQFLRRFWNCLNLRHQHTPNEHHQESITRSLQLPHILVTAFSQTDLFLVLNLFRIQLPTGTSVTNCNHKHALMLTCRHVHVRPHCFILTEASWYRLELAFFAGKTSKNTLVCKSALHWLIMGVAGS